MNDIKNYDTLRRVIHQKLDTWNERSNFTISGVRNISRSDMNCLLICCDWYERNGSLEGLDYFSPEVRSVLEKFDMYEEVRKR